VHYGWEWDMMQLLWEIVFWSLKRLNVELLYDPVVPLLGIYIKGWGT
jgi:hypothetical protein